MTTIITVKNTTILINVRRLTFHFQPNISVEAKLMNVVDQRWFDVDVFARNVEYLIKQFNSTSEWGLILRLATLWLK